jgi:hypothetical protein
MDVTIVEKFLKSFFEDLFLGDAAEGGIFRKSGIPRCAFQEDFLMELQFETQKVFGFLKRQYQRL